MEVFKNLWKETRSLSYRWGRCHCDLSTFLQTNNILILKQTTTFMYYKQGSENANFSLSQDLDQANMQVHKKMTLPYFSTGFLLL